MTNYQIPQNIDIPDTIFFGLSFKQIIYLGGGAGSMVLLYVYTNLILTILIGGPIMGLAAGLAFYTFNNQPFIVLLQAMVQYVTTPKLYQWQKKTGDGIGINHREAQKKFIVEAPKQARSAKLSDLNATLTFEGSAVETTKK